MRSDSLPDEATPGFAGEEEAALERAMAEAPRGTIAIAGTAVVLLMLGWFFVYIFIFLPRGSVG